MGSVLDFSVVLERMPELLWGCLGTFALALAGMSLALVIGLVGVVLRSSNLRIVRMAVIGFVELDADGNRDDWDRRTPASLTALACCPYRDPMPPVLLC